MMDDIFRYLSLVYRLLTAIACFTQRLEYASPHQPMRLAVIGTIFFFNIFLITFISLYSKDHYMPMRGSISLDIRDLRRLRKPRRQRQRERH